MPVFNFSGQCEVSNKELDITDVINTAKKMVCKNYYINKVDYDDSSIRINGNIKGIFKRAVTNAEVSFKIKDFLLIYKAKGKVSFGYYPWLWIGLLMITIFGGTKMNDTYFGLILIFSILMFISETIKYQLYKNKTTKFFEELVETIKFDFGKI